MEPKMNICVKLSKLDVKKFQKLKGREGKMILPRDLFNRLVMSKNLANDY
jgi:hypothetical protein